MLWQFDEMNGILRFGESAILNFSFQAEDGMRYYKVTGVQTCALPICGLLRRRRGQRELPPALADRECRAWPDGEDGHLARAQAAHRRDRACREAGRHSRGTPVPGDRKSVV